MLISVLYHRSLVARAVEFVDYLLIVTSKLRRELLLCVVVLRVKKLIMD